jgi:hypothetical protein
LILRDIENREANYPQKPPLGIVSGVYAMKSKPVYQQKPGSMKTASGRFLERLIANMPIGSLRKSAGKENRFSGQIPKRSTVGKEETLHRIFMARYRVQHL